MKGKPVVMPGLTPERASRRIAAGMVTTGRYEVGILGGRTTRKFSRKRAAIEFARVLARKKGVETVMYDRGARKLSQQIWLLNDKGLIRSIGHRTVATLSEAVH